MAAPIGPTADGTGAVEAAFPIFGGANGIGISPDGKTLYVAETETGRLWAWDVEAPGRLRKDPWPSSNGGRVICQFPGYRRLDFIAIAASGNIIVATLVAGEITTVSPAGEILRVVKMPERMPTNICFGGPDMRTAYITLSTSGKLAAMHLGRTGVAPAARLTARALSPMPRDLLPRIRREPRMQGNGRHDDQRRHHEAPGEIRTDQRRPARQRQAGFERGRRQHHAERRRELLHRAVHRRGRPPAFGRHIGEGQRGQRGELQAARQPAGRQHARRSPRPARPA